MSNTPKSGFFGFSRLTGRIATVSMLIGVAYLWFITPLSLTSLLASAARNGLAVLAVLSRVPDAIAMLHEEQRRTADEREAFTRFGRRIANLEVEQPGTDGSVAPPAGNSPQQLSGIFGGSTDASGGSATHAGTSIADVKDCYRETVMGVRHYEQEYDEPLMEHLAQEFGTELAIALDQSETMTPQLRQALLTQAMRARDERTDLLHELDEEECGLTTASNSLEGIHRTILTVEESLSRRADRELADAWRRLDELEADCRELLATRQDRIADRNRELSIQEYLYTDGVEEWTYPVLGDCLDEVDRISTAKQRVVDTILRRA